MEATPVEGIWAEYHGLHCRWQSQCKVPVGFGGNEGKPRKEKHEAKGKVVKMKLERWQGPYKPGLTGHVKDLSFLLKSITKSLKGFCQGGKMLRILFRKN